MNPFAKMAGWARSTKAPEHIEWRCTMKFGEDRKPYYVLRLYMCGRNLVTGEGATFAAARSALANEAIAAADRAEKRGELWEAEKLRTVKGRI